MMKAKDGNGLIMRLLKGLSSREDHDVLKLNVIYLINGLVSLGVIIMFWIQFYSPVFHVGWRRSVICFILGTLYVFYKEIKRWLGQHGEHRRGDLWVLGWWISYGAMELISFLWLESKEPPVEHFFLTLAITVEYLLTRLSKCWYEYKKNPRRRRGKQ